MAARKANGQFAKGHSGNPKGRSKRTTEERYIAAMVRTVRIGDWEKIVLTGIARAKAGDVGWARFIGDYLMGKPVQRTEVTGKDGGPIRHQESPADFSNLTDEELDAYIAICEKLGSGETGA